VLALAIVISVRLPTSQKPPDLLALGEANEVLERSQYALDFVLKGSNDLLDIALDHLSLGQAALALGEREDARTQFEWAVEGLRNAGHLRLLPPGLLARAALLRETGDHDKARADLAEAMRLARRCGMRLFECDAHLEYARLLAEDDRKSAREHLAEAKRLVEACGYHRRDGEVAALEVALGG
jgi:tetratricopeptide (TPR) repeat protein